MSRFANIEIHFVVTTVFHHITPSNFSWQGFDDDLEAEAAGILHAENKPWNATPTKE
jgi:hypothetical protein